MQRYMSGFGFDMFGPKTRHTPLHLLQPWQATFLCFVLKKTTYLIEYIIILVTYCVGYSWNYIFFLIHSFLRRAIFFLQSNKLPKKAIHFGENTKSNGSSPLVLVKMWGWIICICSVQYNVWLYVHSKSSDRKELHSM